MGFRRRFEFGLAWRTAVLVAAIWLLAQALSTPDLRAARIVAAPVAFAALSSLWQFIRRTNFQVARFIESVRFEDYSQRFSDPSGGGFDVLGETLDAALKTLKEQKVAATNYLSSVTSRDRLADLLDKEWQGPVPYTVVIAPGGKVLYRKSGPLEPLAVRRAVVDFLGRTYASRPK